MARPYVCHRWTAAALAAVGGLFAVSYVLLPHWSTQYGAWLAIFSIWMVWFTVAARRWIDDADF
jgi:hypothetical protein